MKLNPDFLVHKTKNETIIVPTGNAGFSGVVKGNETFGAILEFLKKDTTQQQIVDAMLEQYDAPRKVIEKDVADTISKLRKIGAIDE